MLSTPSRYASIRHIARMEARTHQGRHYSRHPYTVWYCRCAHDFRIAGFGHSASTEPPVPSTESVASSSSDTVCGGSVAEESSSTVRIWAHQPSTAQSARLASSNLKRRASIFTSERVKRGGPTKPSIQPYPAPEEPVQEFQSLSYELTGTANIHAPTFHSSKRTARRHRATNVPSMDPPGVDRAATVPLHQGVSDRLHSWTLKVPGTGIWCIVGADAVDYNFSIPPGLAGDVQPSVEPPGRIVATTQGDKSMDWLPITSIPKAHSPRASEGLTPLPRHGHSLASPIEHIPALHRIEHQYDESGQSVVLLFGQHLDSHLHVFWGGDPAKHVMVVSGNTLMCAVPPECIAPLPIVLVRFDGVVFPTSLTI